MERETLKNLNIWGTFLSSREGKILHYTIPCLLKYCKKVLIMLDNENEETKKIVMDYQKKYPDRIVVRSTGFPRATAEQEADLRGLFRRFKPIQGKLRDTIFQYFRDITKEGEKVDMIIFPDSDEVWTKELPDILEKFWLMKDKLAISTKPITVFGDMKTVAKISMGEHSRIFKFFPELTAIPWHPRCNHKPLTRETRLCTTKLTIHLMLLTKEKILWRRDHWADKTPLDSEPLWRLPRDARDMTFSEIKEIFKTKPDLTVGKFLNIIEKK